MSARPEPVEIRGARTLTRAQEQLWAGQRLAPDSPVGDMAIRFRIAGPIDVDRFVEAIETVVQASDSLRTVVADVSGRPAVRVLDHPPAPTAVLDLDAALVDDWVVDRLGRPLDLSTSPYDSVVLRHGSEGITWFLNVNHVVYDATSTGVVLRAVEAAYTGSELELTPYADWRDHLETTAEKASTQKARAHWGARVQRTGPTPVYGFNGVRVTTAAERLAVGLTPETGDRLEALLGDDRARTVSPELSRTVLVASAMALWLHRITGEPEHTIGIPIHNRVSAAFRQSVGLFVELFPLDVVIHSSDTIADVVAQVRTSMLELLRHARPGTAPAQDFDIVLNQILTTVDGFAGSSCEIRWDPTGHMDRNHLARVQVHDWNRTGRMEIDLDLAIDVADRPTRAAAGAHLAAVLDAVAHDLATPVRDLTDLSGDEESALAEYNCTGPALECIPLVGPLLGELARRSDPIIESAGGSSISGPELINRLEGVAAHLVAEGVGPGDRVALAMDRSADAVIAILAVLRVGASFVIVDTDQTDERQQFVIDDCGALLVLRALPAMGPDRDRSELIAPAEIAGDDEAYVLYTSGSTGVPKGVPISHAGLADYLAFASAAYVLPERPPVAGVFTSMAFDLTITSLFVPLLTGGRLVVFPGHSALALFDALAHPDVTMLKATPSHLRLMGSSTSIEARIDTLIVGGEAFPVDLANEVRRILGSSPSIFNEYGPTEAVVGCMIHRFDPTHDTGAEVPVGVPAPGVRLHVIDDLDRPVPVGVPGELLIHRAGLTAGYLERPELNAQRFAVLPHLDDGRLYRTGDRVVLEPDGGRLVMTYLGRTDDQLKVQGVRLEAGEIEAAILSHPAVERAVVRLFDPTVAPPTSPGCVRCGITDSVPGVGFDALGVCTLCRHHEQIAPQAQAYFRTEDDLRQVFAAASARGTGDYDCLALLSGGKDSTYVLYQLVAMGYRPYAFTLDNGFISEEAKANVRRAVEDLGVDHEFATTEHMNEIFRDSLDRFSNVCNGCYKTIYTLSINRARQLGIPLIVTGLSRGQLFETRLTPEQFEQGRFDPEAIDRTVLEARKVYHRIDDAVNQLLDVSAFATDEVFDEVEFVDFYRYHDVPLDEMYRFLDERAPWVRPSDTGRSTNCLINAAGIEVHKTERGFHNYALPYSWDVRMGHKTRSEAVHELDDPSDHDEVERLLGEVGYRPRIAPILTAWFVASEGVGAAELRDHLRTRLPAHAVPAALVAVDEIPLTANGKVATELLPRPERIDRMLSEGYVAPDGDLEEELSEIWAEVLGLERIGVHDDFFDSGGTSLQALEMIVWVADTWGVRIPEVVAFRQRTVRTLANELEQILIADIADLSEREVERALTGAAETTLSEKGER